MADIKFEAITSDLGAYAKISAAHLLDDGIAEQCLAALNTYGVLVFPQISVSDEDQVAISNTLGKMETSKLPSVADTKADNLGIYPVTLDPDRAKFIDYIISNEHWHMDGTSYKVPPKATNLKCEVPPSSGGDTEFANLFAAYDALPAPRKAALEKLRVVHTLEAANLRSHKNPSTEDLARWRRTAPPIEHPLVWRQADGRTSLVIGSSADHIVGMDSVSGTALLEELLDWCTQPQYCYRHKWEKGDMVVWNNCGLLHRAHHYTRASGRLMHRTTIMGAQAFA